ncbi:MAG TPA: HIT family protein [Kiritimatiellia bacterium]
MSETCVFCKIIRGEIPSTRIYEDDEVLAFMDIGPIVKGHTLVIPKRHLDPVTAVPPDLLLKVMKVVQKVVQAQLNGLKADGVNVHQSNGAAAGQVVPHAHFHVIPRFANDGHTWNWAAKKYESMDEVKKLAEAIKAGM